jgi:hypothetical protein
MTGIPETAGHTRGDNNPDEVHQKVIHPKIIWLRSGIWSAVDIVVKQTGRIIQGVAVQMAHAHNYLDWVAQGMPDCGQVCNNEAQWSPQELSRKQESAVNPRVYTLYSCGTHHGHCLHT